MELNSGQLTGINSVAAFNFMVQLPRLIMEVFKLRSLFSSDLMYRIISLSL
jgi:hypothetical protein